MKKVVMRAPVLSQSGYGEHARFVMRALAQYPDEVDLYLININWGKTSWLWEDNEERKWIDKILKKTQEYLQSEDAQFDISIQVTIPNEWEKMAKVNIGVTAGIEVDRISPVWIEKSELMDKVIVPSEFSKWGFDSTSYKVKSNTSGEIIDDWKNKTPVEVVPYPVKDIIPEDLKLDLKTDFNFLTVAQWSPRKNIEALVKWFIEEFHDDENVGLILKTSMTNNSNMDRVKVRDKIKNYIKHNFPKKKCNVYILHGYLLESQMKAVYNDDRIKAFCTATHGEGFGLPLFDASIAGMPIIAPEWSAHKDFLTMPQSKGNKIKDKFMAIKVDYDLAPIAKESIWQGVLEEGSQWCHPKEFSFKHALRKLYNNPGVYKKRAKKLSLHVKNKYNSAAMHEKMYNTIMRDYIGYSDIQIEDMFNNLSKEQNV
jgi:glycosyltransferase involved in cell wall biosynthesis|tara:strand:- start:1338 stop:2618 length:1281 start_codon:yes stop_codon:yes gene_type:complete